MLQLFNAAYPEFIPFIEALKAYGSSNPFIEISYDSSKGKLKRRCLEELVEICRDNIDSFRVKAMEIQLERIKSIACNEEDLHVCFNFLDL
jgi:hypothetical protein